MKGTSNMVKNNSKYIKGDALYGDDFSLAELERWVEDENEGYATIVKNNERAYEYPYYELDKQCVFKYLPKNLTQMHILAIGGAYGYELQPILKRAKKIDIIEPSNLFLSNNIDGVPVSYIKPQSSGVIPFDNDTFDLIVCFSVLHHIANVSFVLKEITRVLRPGGYLLHRDPIVAMRHPLLTNEDFQRPMTGLSRRERGIPLKYFRNQFKELGFNNVSEKLVGMPTTRRLAKLISGHSPYNSKYWVGFDRITSLLFKRNVRYSRGSVPKIFAISPQIVCNVLIKNS